MKLSDVKLLQKVRLAHEPPIEVAPINPDEVPCYRGSSDFPFAEQDSIGTVIGITCEKIYDIRGQNPSYYPLIQVTNDNLGQIEVPPECLEPYDPSYTMDVNRPIGVTINGDLVFSFKKD